MLVRPHAMPKSPHDHEPHGAPPMREGDVEARMGGIMLLLRTGGAGGCGVVLLHLLGVRLETVGSAFTIGRRAPCNAFMLTSYFTTYSTLHRRGCAPALAALATLAPALAGAPSMLKTC